MSTLRKLQVIESYKAKLIQYVDKHTVGDVVLPSLDNDYVLAICMTIEQVRDTLFTRMR